MSGLIRPRPSSAERWVGGGCPGSVKLESQCPRTTSPAAENGNRLHGLAATALRGGPREYGEEDAKVIDPYVADVQREHQARTNSKLYIETESWNVHFPGIRGTPDAVVVDFVNRHIIVWDLKTGWRIVEALGNWQLTCYTLTHCRPGWTHEVRIVQPLPYHRDGPIRAWGISYDELLRRGQVIGQAIQDVAASEPILRPGAHCLYCDALAACPAARDVTLGAVDYHVARELDEVPDEHLGRELQVMRETLKIIQLRVGALEETAAAKLRSGAQIPGVCMREGSGGRTKWAVDEEQARFSLRLLMGKDPAVPKLPTPTQLKSAGVSEDLLRPFTKYQPGKMVVSTDADDHAKKVFGNAPNMEFAK